MSLRRLPIVALKNHWHTAFLLVFYVRPHEKLAGDTALPCPTRNALVSDGGHVSHLSEWAHLWCSECKAAHATNLSK